MSQTYRYILGSRTYQFADLAELLAKASPSRSGDRLAGVIAESAEERAVAQMLLAETPLKVFLNEALVPYEQDEVTRLIIDDHDAAAFERISHLTVGDFRNWLLSDETTTEVLTQVRSGITPEMAAAVSKIMRNQDLILVAQKCRVVTAFRNTIGLPKRLSTRLQPNHPTDDVNGIAASIFDGLLYGSGDAVIGINPATDNVTQATRLMSLMDEVISLYEIPTQSCVLTHVTNTLECIENGAPVDLVFQSIGGTEKTNSSFGFNLSTLAEAQQAALALKRGTVGQNVMYFETGQGSALSANAHHGLDQQTCEARAYAVARKFNPLLVNTVVGFIGPEYLFDGKEIIRAGLEDHFCGKLLGLPMGCDVCYTNHAEADQSDMDNLLTLLGTAGCSFVMGIPGSDDIMLNYQTTSFHDALYARRVLGLGAAPEFEAWLEKIQIMRNAAGVRLNTQLPPAFAASVTALPDRETAGKNRVKPVESPNHEAHGQAWRGVVDNPWRRLRQFTAARIGIGRAGISTPTQASLDFQLAHAQARDAVHTAMDWDSLKQALFQLAEDYPLLNSAPPLMLHSQAPDRMTYLQRPDRGRQLNEESRQLLTQYRSQQPFDLALVVADGLSATAIEENALPFIRELVSTLSHEQTPVSLAPIALVKQGRVAIGDDVGECLKARVVLVLIGERPGLSSPDSLGLYLTWAPKRGLTDDKRNCISNVRIAGLSYSGAARKCLYLLNEARRLQCSGVAIKDRSTDKIIDSHAVHTSFLLDNKTDLQVVSTEKED